MSPWTKNIAAGALVAVAGLGLALAGLGMAGFYIAIVIGAPLTVEVDFRSGLLQRPRRRPSKAAPTR